MDTNEWIYDNGFKDVPIGAPYAEATTVVPLATILYRVQNEALCLQYLNLADPTISIPGSRGFYEEDHTSHLHSWYFYESLRGCEKDRRLSGTGIILEKLKALKSRVPGTPESR